MWGGIPSTNSTTLALIQAIPGSLQVLMEEAMGRCTLNSRDAGKPCMRSERMTGPSNQHGHEHGKPAETAVRLMQHLSSYLKDKEVRTKAHIQKYDKLHYKMLDMRENLAKHRVILQAISETPTLSTQSLGLGQKGSLQALADAMTKRPPPSKESMDLLHDRVEKVKTGFGKLLVMVADVQGVSAESGGGWWR